jgi:hypothetical protein
MEITIKDGAICINLEQAFGELTPEAKKRAAEIIGADIEAWKEMARAVADPLGTYCLHEGPGSGCCWLNSDQTNEVRELLAPLMPEVARIALEKMKEQRDQAVTNHDRVSAWAWAMYHSRDVFQRPFPALPEWAPADEARLRERDAAPEMRKALETAALVIHAPHALTFESCPDSVCSENRAALTLAREGK